MVDLTSKENNEQALGANANMQQGQPTPQMQYTAPESTGSVFDLFNGDLSSHADGTSGVRAASVNQAIKEYREKEKVNSAWQQAVIVNPELPNGEMLAIYVVIHGDAYLHPVIFSEVGGRTYQSAGSANGLAGTIVEAKASSASITRVKGFKEILLNHLRTQGNADVQSTVNINVCGCTQYHRGLEIKPNNLLANASNEIFAALSARNSKRNPHAVTTNDFKGTEIMVDSTTQVDKTNIHGQHVFAPVVLTGTVRSDSQLEGNLGKHSVALGDVCGFMDFAPYAPQFRQQEMMRRQQAGDATPVPHHKPFFVITDEEWAMWNGKASTPENLLTLFMLLPSIAEGALWVPRVTNAGDVGFNPLYDFASVGYDEEGFNKPFDECHVSTKFDLAMQRKYANEWFSSVSICIDLAMSGPNAGGMSLMTDAGELNKLITNLTGHSPNFQSIGEQKGRIPLGTYDYQGKKRDIRELLNYYSWAKFVKGDKVQLQRWHTWFGQFDGNNDERVFAERLKMANEISMGTFELTDTAIRIVINDDVIMSLRNAFTSNGTRINVAANLLQQTESTYGFAGGFSGGMKSTTQTQQAGSMGAPVVAQSAW